MRYYQRSHCLVRSLRGPHGPSLEAASTALTSPTAAYHAGAPKSSSMCGVVISPVALAVPSAHTVGHSTTWSGGLMRTTRPNLFLPPSVARALTAGALLLGQTFYIAYRRESQKLDDEEKENERESGQSGARADKPFMSPAEAIQVLGIEKSNPALLSEARNISDGSRRLSDVLPLRNARDREVAKENFDRMFGIAMKHNNLFIAGKLSNAYRMCADPDWDANLNSSSNDTADKEQRTEKIGANQDEQTPPPR